MRRVVGSILLILGSVLALFCALIAAWASGRDTAGLLGGAVTSGALAAAGRWIKRTTLPSSQRRHWIRGISGWLLCAVGGGLAVMEAISIVLRPRPDARLASAALGVGFFGSLAVAGVLRVRSVGRTTTLFASVLRPIGWSVISVGVGLLGVLVADRFIPTLGLTAAQSPELALLCCLFSAAGVWVVRRGGYAPLPEPPPALPETASATLVLDGGAVFAGSYRVRGKLGSGGMSIVYDAEEIGSGRRVALKLLRASWSADPSMRARFVREAEVVAKIANEHLVPVYAAGVDVSTGTPWIAMELLEGETLAERVHRDGPLSIDAVTDVLRQLCDALASAHADGIVHRDVKPENVFVLARRHASSLDIKLLDFGIAKTLARGDVAELLDSSTAPLPTAAVIGSPIWMAPEQMSLGVVGPPTDLWALGLLAFWALTGRSYWKASNTHPIGFEALMREKLFEPLAPASERANAFGCEGRLPHGFDTWFASCVVRDPAARFQDADAVRIAFEAMLASR